MSFESKMKKHIQKVFDEHVPNPYEKVEVKKPFAMRKILMPLGVAALACTLIVAVILPLGLIGGRNYGESVNSNEEPVPGHYSNDHDGKDNGGGTSSEKGFNEDPNFVEKISICAAPKATVLSTVSDSFVNRTATKTLNRLDNLFTDSSKKNYVVSPASFLLGVSSLTAVSEGIDTNNFGLSDPLNETKMLLEKWNCCIKETNSTTGEEEVVTKIDSGVLHQQVGSKFEFDDQKRMNVEDEYIATGAVSPSNYRQQAQNYFADNVKLSMPVPDLGLNKDCVVSYSTLKFQDDADLGATEQRHFTIGSDTISVSACVYGDSSEHTYPTEIYQDTKYTAFKRQIRNSSILFILPNHDYTLEDISISSAYIDFMQNKTDCLAFGYIPYFHVRNIGMDMSSAVTNTFDGSEKLYSKLLKDGISNRTLELKMIQNSDYAFADDGTNGQSSQGSTGRNPGQNGGSSAICLDVNRPFYAICLKDDFPMFVSKVTDPRK